MCGPRSLADPAPADSRRHPVVEGPHAGGGGNILANERGPETISANAIAAGPVPIRLFIASKSDEKVAKISQTIPPDSSGESDDIAAAFLCGPDGFWINGQGLRANDGVV